ALRRRRHVPARDHLAPGVLDHEHARLAVHVQSHVAFHRAALLRFGAPSRLTPWSTANRIAAEGSPSSLLRLSASPAPTARTAARSPLTHGQPGRVRPCGGGTPAGMADEISASRTPLPPKGVWCPRNRGHFSWRGRPPRAPAVGAHPFAL